MNEITLKLECACGAKLETAGPDGNRAWMRQQADAWLEKHEGCLGKSVVSGPLSVATPSGVKLTPRDICECGHTLANHDQTGCSYCTCGVSKPVQTDRPGDATKE